MARRIVILGLALSALLLLPITAGLLLVAYLQGAFSLPASLQSSGSLLAGLGVQPSTLDLLQGSWFRALWIGLLRLLKWLGLLWPGTVIPNYSQDGPGQNLPPMPDIPPAPETPGTPETPETPETPDIPSPDELPDLLDPVPESVGLPPSPSGDAGTGDAGTGDTGTGDGGSGDTGSGDQGGEAEGGGEDQSRLGDAVDSYLDGLPDSVGEIADRIIYGRRTDGGGGR